MIRVGNTYKVFQLHKCMSKKGNPFIAGSICDSKKDPVTNEWLKGDWYKILCFDSADEIEQSGKIKISEIKSIEKTRFKAKNGKVYEDIQIIVSAQAADGSKSSSDYEDAVYSENHSRGKKQQYQQQQMELEPLIDDDGDLPF